MRGRRSPPRPVTLFLCGDVMLGRGLDQVMPNPSEPTLHESYMRNALDYVALTERSSGAIPRPVAFSYIWGDALAELEQRGPAARIINLETSITRSDRPWPNKGIHYRMHPGNVPCISAARIDCCVLANNHVIDWGREGLVETVATLRRERIGVAGAGADLASAREPATLPLAGEARVLVFAAATGDSGVPEGWAAGTSLPGVHRLPDLSATSVAQVATDVHRHRRSHDVVVFSLHWGGNWDYAISPEQRAFAHALIDSAGVDIVYGHSSHHVKAIEVYRDRLILYGCGDFLNDYEGITGHDEFRDDLGIMYFPLVDAATGRLRELNLVPTRIRRLRVNRAEGDDRRWLLATLRRECASFGCDVTDGSDGAFSVSWRPTAA